MMPDYSLGDFLRDVLGCSPPWTLRQLGRSLPTPEAVDQACAQVEAWCQADQAEAEAAERRRLESL